MKMNMNIDEFIEKIKPEFIDSSSFITAETKFRELSEWDSLTGMSILVLLEDEYGKRIPTDIFKSCITFYDIYVFINEES